jgi:hypothetical protein
MIGESGDRFGQWMGGRIELLPARSEGDLKNDDFPLQAKNHS